MRVIVLLFSLVFFSVLTAPPSHASSWLTLAVQGGSPDLLDIEFLVPGASPTNADTLTWRVRFSEPVSNVDASDFSVSATTATLSVVMNSAEEFDVTASGGDLAGLNASVTLDLLGSNDIVDADNRALRNLVPTRNNERTYEVDNILPEISLSSANPDPVTGSFAVTFTFTEDVIGFDVTDVSIGNGTASQFGGTGTSYSVTVTPDGDGIVEVNVSQNAASDEAGNGNAAASALTRQANVQPSVEISTTASEPAPAAFIVTFSFSEPVTGFELGDVQVTNGTAGGFSGSGANYSITIDVTADGEVIVNVPGGVAQGASIYSNSAATPLSIDADATAPVLTIASDAGPVVNGPFNVDLMLSESPKASLTVSDILSILRNRIYVQNGSLPTISSVLGSRTSFTAVVSPASDGEVRLGDAFLPFLEDNAGNNMVLAEEFSRSVAISPTVTISTTATEPAPIQFPVSFVFSDPVTGFELTDVLVTNGRAEGLSGSGASYSATIRPDADGDVTVEVPANSALGSNGAGNAAGTPLTINADATPPLLTISTAAGEVVQGWFEVNLTLSESPKASLTLSNIISILNARISVLNGDLHNLVSVSNSRTEFSGTVFAIDDGVVRVSDGFVPALEDEAGNNAVLASELTRTAVRPPHVEILSGASGTVNGAFQVEIRFDERDITGFQLDDVMVTNGTGSDFTTLSTHRFEVTITPTDNGLVRVEIPAGAAQDSEGNNSLTATPLEIEADLGVKLTVVLSGLGAGSVSSDIPGINCGSTCQAFYPDGQTVVLSATSEEGSSFHWWVDTNCRDGQNNPTCSLTLSETTTAYARFTLASPPEGRIVAATLPGARSGYVGGNDITVFMSVLSRQTTPAQACRITAPNDPPFTLTYRQLDAQNQPIGDANPLFDLASGGGINFVVALTPTQTTPAAGYIFLPQIACENADLAPIEGVNSVLVSIGAAPVPDILSIGATPSADGVVRIPAAGNRINFLSVAALNIGVGDGSAGANEATVTASVDTGAASLPVTLEVCETAPTGGCITPRGETAVTTVFAQNVAKFFAVFVRANGEETVPFSPANSRVFLRFADASGAIRSVTSAAISAPAPANDPAEAASLTGRWSVLVRQPSGEWPSLRRASLYVLEDGTAILDDGASVTTPMLEHLAADNEITRFELSGYQGLTREATIQSGDALSDEPGALWGVRDARSDTLATWSDMAGDYGSLRVGSDGTISGTLAGCFVNGAPQDRTGSAGLLVADVTLAACEASGRYTAVIDQPVNDNDASALVIGGASGGWRVAAVR